MPIIKSAKKAARQADKRTLHNQEIKKNIKLARKNLAKNPSYDNLKKAQSELDKAVKKNLLKKNTASRHKSALVKLAKSLGVKVEASKKSAKAEAKPEAKPAKKPTTKAAKPAKAETKKSSSTYPS